jgi:hypothetical protein
MSKAAFIVLLSIGLLTMAGCKGATAGVKNIPGISDEDAYRVLSGDVNLLHCGDRYFQETGELDELKDPTFNIDSRFEKTQADSLNGVTWHAMVSLRASSIRHYIYSGDGGRWSMWSNSYLPLPFEVMVINGRLEPAYTLEKPHSCSNIPPG